ncbi:Ada metal-binding domain-containing protein [uncultured Fibrella sp.]|uniref:Ada metal-binding domain-containing protein n=1 Tax=uncultured Fibrella sp. TaxID=1284596 RepID=UPI0035CC5AEF
MIHQTRLGATRFSQLRELVRLVGNDAVTLAGNRPGKIYGQLNCRAGKRMNARNRVFFQNQIEAVDAGFRPCAVCLPEAYKRWKASQEDKRT